MKKLVMYCGTIGCALALMTSEAPATDNLVHVTPSDGVAFLVKCFPVDAGTHITGVSFRNDGSETAFPEVIVVRAPTSSLDTGTLVGRATSTSQQSSAEAYASLGDGILVAGADQYCVGIRVPERSGSSPGIGASIVTTPVGCYIAAGMDGPMGVALVDLDIDLVTSDGAGKARPPSPTLSEVFLGQASPNPFNPTTTVEFGVPTPTTVTLRVFDVTGRMVRELLNDRIGAGIHRRVWDGRDSNGASVAAGIYMIHLVAGNTILHEKIVLVK